MFDTQARPRQPKAVSVKATATSRNFAAAIRQSTRLFEVILGQINRKLGDEGCAAPVGAKSAGIDRGEGAVEPGVLGARERVAVAFIEIGVKVAQIERELLPRKPEADVPIGIALIRNAAREADYRIEAIRGFEEPMTEIG